MAKGNNSITVTDELLSLTITPSEELDKAFLSCTFLPKESGSSDSAEMATTASPKEISSTDKASSTGPAKAPASNPDYAFLLATVTKYIPEEFINTGVLKDVAAQLGEGKNIESRRIAKGIPAKDGRDGKLVLLVKEFGSPAEFLTDSFGFIDYKNVRLFDNVSVGQPVARLYRAKPGVPGRDVFGQPLKAKDGKAVDIRLKDGLELRTLETEPYDEICALSEGCLYREGQALWVSDTISISGDMDTRMGHSEFVGKDHVKGNGSGKFRLAERQGLEIDGDVEGAELLSTQGSIIVKGKVFGSGTTKIIGRESMTVDIVVNCLVETGAALHVRREVRESQLYAASFIKVEDGFVVLSEIYCAKGVVAKQLGSEGEGHLNIHLVPASQTSSVYRDLTVRQEQHVSGLALLEAHLGPFLKVRNRVQNLKEPHRSKIEKLFEKYDALTKSLGTLREKMADFEGDDEAVSHASVNFREACYPGVNVFSGSAQLEVKEQIAGPGGFRLSEDRQEIVSTEFVDISEVTDEKAP